MVSDPDFAPIILMYGGWLLTGQSLGAAVHDKKIVPETVQGAIHTDPQIALAIFKQRPDPIAVVLVAWLGRHEAAVVQAAEPSVSSSPEISGAVLAERTHQVVGKAVAGI